MSRKHEIKNKLYGHRLQIGASMGENIGKALSNGLNSGLWGGAIGGFTGGITGGIRAARSGNDFWSGGEKRVQRYKFNHYPSSDKIKDGCFPMTLGELDPENNAEYYKNLISEFFASKDIASTSMKNPRLVRICDPYPEHPLVKHKML
jgi:hypothetical protein